MPKGVGRPFNKDFKNFSKTLKKNHKSIYDSETAKKENKKVSERVINETDMKKKLRETSSKSRKDLKMNIERKLNIGKKKTK